MAGIAGIALQYTLEDYITALEKANGVVKEASRILNINFRTLHKKIGENPELKKALDELREVKLNLDLDIAESTLNRAMQLVDSDPANALKAVFFFLNNKGESRGYSRKNNPNYGESANVDIREVIQYLKDPQRTSGTKES